MILSKAILTQLVFSILIGHDIGMKVPNILKEMSLGSNYINMEATSDLNAEVFPRGPWKICIQGIK